jgi:hypothetical protein
MIAMWLEGSPVSGGVEISAGSVVVDGVVGVLAGSAVSSESEHPTSDIAVASITITTSEAIRNFFVIPLNLRFASNSGLS